MEFALDPSRKGGMRSGPLSSRKRCNSKKKRSVDGIARKNVQPRMENRKMSEEERLILRGVKSVRFFTNERGSAL